jgi:hypothetical protein
MCFDDYMSQVDLWLLDMCDLTSADLPDYDFWNAYEDLVPAKICARRVIAAAEFF